MPPRVQIQYIPQDSSHPYYVSADGEWVATLRTPDDVKAWLHGFTTGKAHARETQ